jgi:hypothetical protein
VDQTKVATLEGEATRARTTPHSAEQIAAAEEVFFHGLLRIIPVSVVEIIRIAIVEVPGLGVKTPL